jgi:hypothetical protein
MRANHGGPLLVMLAVLLSPAAVGQQRHLAYEGYALDADIPSLRRRFAGSIQVDNPQAFILSFKEPAIGRDRITYVQLDLDAHGKVRRLSISYEVDGGRRGHSLQPRCGTVRRRLTKAYGAPTSREKPFYEEVVRHDVVHWRGTDEVLTLDCADDEPGITIEPLPAGAHR